MTKLFRWILAVPTCLATSVVVYFVATLLWNVSSTIHIVSLDGPISMTLASACISAIAAGIGVIAGAKLLPTDKHQAAKALGVLSTICVILSFTFTSGMDGAPSLYWRYVILAGWIIGAVIAVGYVKKPLQVENNA